MMSQSLPPCTIVQRSYSDGIWLTNEVAKFSADGAYSRKVVHRTLFFGASVVTVTGMLPASVTKQLFEDRSAFDQGVYAIIRDDYRAVYPTGVLAALTYLGPPP